MHTAGSSNVQRPAKRVLIVEDDDDARDVLGELIFALGHSPVQAANGREALAELERSRVDLALIDLSLPEFDGREVARRIRQTAFGAEIHLVALTGYSDDETRRSAVEAGFDDFLVKPAFPASIERVVNAAPSVRAPNYDEPAAT